MMQHARGGTTKQSCANHPKDRVAKAMLPIGAIESPCVPEVLQDATDPYSNQTLGKSKKSEAKRTIYEPVVPIS